MAQYKRKLNKGFRWYYKISYNGRIHFSKCIYLSKAEAKKAEAELISELEDRERNPNKDIELPLFELMNERLDFIKANNSEKHYSESQRYLKVFYRYMGNVMIQDITKADLNRFFVSIASKKKKGKKGESIKTSNYPVNAMLRVVKALFYYAIETYELNMRNPCKGIDFYPIDKKMKYIPSDDELTALLNLCNDEQKTLVEFVRDTGARINEAIALMGKDVGDDYVVLYTRKSHGGNRVPRKVPKPDCLIGKSFSPNKRVFSGWTIKPHFLKRKIMLLKTQMWGWHCLRHRYASLLSKEGKPLFEIMKFLGHSNIETTQIYLQLM